MTYKEKFKLDHPELTEEAIDDFVLMDCPYEHTVAEQPDYCRGLIPELCRDCWDREISESNETIKKIADKINEIPTVNTLSPTQVKEALELAAKNTEPTIKDSGDRTEFSSGAVRDMREGKGRCDLTPLEVVSLFFETDAKKHTIFNDIAYFQQTDDTCFLVQALASFANEAYGGCYCTMFLEVAKHFEEGAKKYGESNWQKGIPVHCYIDSAVRHYLKWKRGDKDEPHDRAFVWNLMCCIWEVDYHEYPVEESCNGTE